MCLFTLEPFEADLTRAIARPEALELFRDIDDADFLRESRRCADWVDLRRCLESVRFAAALSDPILRPVIRKFQAPDSELWWTVLLYLFWRPVRFMHRKLLYLDRDEPMIVFSQLHWSFLAACSRIDLDARGERFSQKILNDTRHDTKLWFRAEELERRSFDDMFDDEGGLVLDLPTLCLAQATADHEIDRYWTTARLRQLLLDGVLTAQDYQVLLGCHLHGYSLEEMAARLGVPYGVVKKRRQRAEKKVEEFAPQMSPSNRIAPFSK